MSESILWQRLKSGESAALKEIYERHIDFLLGYGQRFAPDPSLVEDAVHDLFVDLWQKRESIGNTDKIRPYLTVALRRRVLKKLKEKGKETGTGENDDYRFQAEPAIDEKITGEEQTKEVRISLVGAMEHLSSREKEALFLKFQHDMDYSDICKVMDISYQSARNLISRAVKKLRGLLEFIIGLILLLFF